MGASSPWLLDPEITFLNHGSFGSCPEPVLRVQDEWRHRLEREPVDFFLRHYEPALEQARQALADVVGADGDDLVFMMNATSAVNTVLRSIRFSPGDEILMTNHVYNACGNAARFVAERSGARVVVADVPFPVETDDQIVAAVVGGVTPNTRIALLDHITSESGIVMPIERLVRELEERGVPAVVDGAHAPGMQTLDLRSLAPAYYTGNCHKWLCAPKGAAFLWVRRDLQDEIRPLTISHGANSTRTDRSRFLIEFDWTGTRDPSAQLAVPAAIEFVPSLEPGGLPALQDRNRELVLEGRRILADALGQELPCPDSMIGSIAVLSLPDARPGEAAQPMQIDPLQERLFHEYKIEVPVMGWPKAPRRVIRIAAQHYNQLDDYTRLADALTAILA